MLGAHRGTLPAVPRIIGDSNGRLGWTGIDLHHRLCSVHHYWSERPLGSDLHSGCPQTSRMPFFVSMIQARQDIFSMAEARVYKYIGART